MQDIDIDEVFAQARGSAPEPDAPFLARIEAEALTVQAGFGGPRAAVPPARRGFAGWIALLGGGPALAGLATMMLAGIWIGVAQPAPVAAVTSGLSAALGQGGDTESVELIPGFDALGTEG